MAVLGLLPPAQHPQSPESVPPAGLAYGLTGRQRQGLVVGPIEKPSPVSLLPALKDLHGLAHARIRRGARRSEVVQPPKDVVVVPGWKGQLQELRVHDLAGRTTAEEATLQQVFLGAASGGYDLRNDVGRRARSPPVLEQTL